MIENETDDIENVFKLLPVLKDAVGFLKQQGPFWYTRTSRQCSSCKAEQSVADDSVDFVHHQKCKYIQMIRNLELHIQAETKFEIERLTNGIETIERLLDES